MTAEKKSNKNSYALIAGEMKNKVIEGSNFVGNYMPEANYYSFSTYIDFLPLLLKEIQYSKFLPQGGFRGPLWNYLDAACCALIGITQIHDAYTHKTHRQKATFVKGMINIGNSAQLFALTAVNFATFGGPSFALCFGLGFLTSLDETIRRIRRYTDKDYWLLDSEGELKLLQTQKTELASEISKMKSTQDRPSGWAWALGRKETRLKELSQKISELEQDITTFKKNGHSLTELLQDKELNALKTALLDNIFWIASTTGMALVCFEATATIGLLVVGVASALYLMKHAYNASTTLYGACFGESANDDDPTAEEKQPLIEEDSTKEAQNTQEGPDNFEDILPAAAVSP